MTAGKRAAANSIGGSPQKQQQKTIKKEAKVIANKATKQTTPAQINNNKNSDFNPLDNILNEIDAFDTTNKPKPKKKRQKAPKIGYLKLLFKINTFFRESNWDWRRDWTMFKSTIAIAIYADAKPNKAFEPNGITKTGTGQYNGSTLFTPRRFDGTNIGL